MKKLIVKKENSKQKNVTHIGMSGLISKQMEDEQNKSNCHKDKETNNKTSHKKSDPDKHSSVNIGEALRTLTEKVHHQQKQNIGNCDPDVDSNEHHNTILIQTELSQNIHEFSFLLNESEDFLYFNDLVSPDRSADIIIEEWNDNLSQCINLKKVFTDIIESSDNSSQFDKKTEILMRWSSYLRSVGIKRFGTYNQTLIISTENRSYFSNGRLFPDGAKVRIQKLPITLNGQLIWQGTLLE